MIITGAMPAQHFSGVSHRRRRSQQIDHDFAGVLRHALIEDRGGYLGLTPEIYASCCLESA
jgi:hypothetical protein